MTLPDASAALQFVVMLQAGLPAEDAIRYFLDTTDPVEIATTVQAWRKSRVVKQAQQAVMGKAWQEMSLDERIQYALNQHYSAMAYLLFSTNYIEANASDKAKIDTARVALETKLAGLSGKGDALSRFFEDLQAGRLKLLGTPLVGQLAEQQAN